METQMTCIGLTGSFTALLDKTQVNTIPPIYLHFLALIEHVYQSPYLLATNAIPEQETDFVGMLRESIKERKGEYIKASVYTAPPRQ